LDGGHAKKGDHSTAAESRMVSGIKDKFPFLFSRLHLADISVLVAVISPAEDNVGTSR
jgi:hypothetical protein